MADLTSILNEVKRLREAVETLPGRINVSAAQVVVVTGLSDITEKLGLVQAGEFRVGNRLIPGDGFSGVRIGYPGFSYGGAIYNIAGVDGDTLMVGIRSSDGTLVAAAGDVRLDISGLTIAANIFGIFFESTGASTDFGRIGLLNDDLFFQNRTPGGEIRFYGAPLAGADSDFGVLSFGEDPAKGSRPQLDNTPIGAGAKITMGNQVELHAQGDDTGETFLLLRGSSDSPSTSDPTMSSANKNIRMYYRTGKIVFQVWSTGSGTDEDLYFYADLDAGLSSDWILSTDVPA